MTKNRTAITLSTAALAVAVLGQTAVGYAAANAVRVALFAQNSGRVNDIQASRTPMPGRLLALNAKGQFPASVVPTPTGARGNGGSYTHTIVVHPDPDVGKAGIGLLNVLNRITDNSATNPYLVKIEPGVYHLGAASLPMKPYVDVEGSGEGVTTLTSTVSSGYGTVVGADHSELRFLTVTNTGSGQQSVALYADSTSPRFLHVTALASGGSENYGIHLSNGSPVLLNVTASASGGGQSFGVANFNGVLKVTGSTLSASDAAGINVGLLTTFGGTTRIVSSTMTGSGGAVAIGMRSYNGSHSLQNVVATGTGSGESYGIRNGQKTSGPNVSVNQSRISGGTNSVFALGGSVKLGASQLTGPAAISELGTVVCVASYDGSFAPLGSNCG
ncbi:MAG: hypothetical protein ABI783_07370 [Actinomycetota bacterium]